MPKPHQTLLAISALLLALISSSCTNTANATFVSRTAPAAHNHIMYVTQTPPTFGYKRLAAFTQLYPDLQVFINQQKGNPDFLAETNKSGNRYLILYYLEKRQTYACRSGLGKSNQIEFSGPYPITDRELKILNSLKNKAKDKP